MPAEIRHVHRKVGKAKKHGLASSPALPNDFQSGTVHEGPNGAPATSFANPAFVGLFSPQGDESHQKFRRWYMTKIPETNLPKRPIHRFLIWYYAGIWFGLNDDSTATNQPAAAGEQDDDKRHEKGVWEFSLATSRDAIHFDFTSY